MQKSKICPEQSRGIKNQNYIRSYITGFLLSCLLTITAYVITVKKAAFTHTFLLFIIPGLAVTQVIVQLIYFLHLGEETKPRWKFLTFLFAVMVIAIIVIGSLWIMQNLNYRMMPTPPQVNRYMHDQTGL